MLLKIPVAHGSLEAMITTPSADAKQIVAIVCHPHPLYGGAMRNKVVTTMTKAFNQLGIPCITFNFRGVEKSTGTYDAAKGEIDDCLAVVDFAKQHYPDAQLWLAGFSFGAYIAIMAAKKTNCQQLITVATPVDHFPLPEDLPTCPWLWLQTDADEVVNAKMVMAFSEKHQDRLNIITFKGASHFSHGRLLELQQALQTALQDKT